MKEKEKRTAAARRRPTKRERERERETEERERGRERRKMPVWTFTSGPNAGKKYEGSSAAESCNDGANGTTDAGTRNLALIMRLLRKEKISCGQVKNLKCKCFHFL